ncbi:hypothetical protein [uncultured Pseudomonas sp.]|uniref:hypothetical protein n=1 Tax=uncultured Pseudomonas sp. TaxID=114707 RepID=UPI0028040405|nr:hypothetical protein [uncultured Pseudomonas sp.]
MRDVSSELPSGEHLLHLLGKLAGGAGILTFLSCVAGAAKLLVMYYWLGCLWVFKLHGFSDFVFEGVGAVTAFAGAAAIAYCISGDHKKILINVSNRLWLLMWVVFFILMWLGASKEIFSQYAYHYFFATTGVNLAGFLSWSMGRRDAFVYALLSIMGFALGALFVSFTTFYWFYNFYDSEMVLLNNSKSNSRGVLINSFSGKYLLRACGPGVKFMVVEPSEDWVSETSGSKWCFGI